MTPTTYNGQDLYLLDVAPDWDSAVELELFSLASAQERLNGTEARRRVSGRLRARFQFRVTAADSDARRLAVGLRGDPLRKVAVPLWVAASTVAQAQLRPLAGGLSLVWRPDWSQWELFEGSIPAWASASDFIAAVVVGRLEGRGHQWLTPTILQADIRLVESSPAAWAIFSQGAEDPQTGPTPSEAWSGPLPIFPGSVNYLGVDSDVSVRVEREAIGFGREEQEDCWQETPSGEFRLTVTESTLEGIASLTEFLGTYGRAGAFWVPGFNSAARLTEDVSPVASAMVVEGTDGLTVGEWILFQTPGASVWRRVVSASSTVLTVAAPVGIPLPASGTLVTPLRLARFRVPRLTLRWLTDRIVEAAAWFRELPQEIAATGEEVGLTAGEVWPPVWLYDFTLEVPGGSVTERFTSYEEDVELEGEIYTAAKVTHGGIRSGVALDRDSVEVTLAAGESSLMDEAARAGSPSPVSVRITEASLDPLQQFGSGFQPEPFQ